MNSTKPFTQSLTVRAALVGIIISIIGMFGIDIPTDIAERTASDAIAFFSAFLTLIASITTIYGRLRAKDKLI